ncbi:MAG: septum formation initiator family protein [Candidatus Saccharimonadales bacterium]
MTTKIKQKLAQIYAKRNQLRDVRVLSQIIFGFIVLAITWSGVKAVQTNYSLQKQISLLKQNDQLQQLKNNNLKLQNKYYNSNQYLNLSARQSFGLGRPGETELIVPKNVAHSHLAKLSKASKSPKQTNRQPFFERNFSAWINFFLHRNSPG